MTTPHWPQYHTTVPALFYERAAKWGERPAIRFKKGGAWTDVTWREFAARVEEVGSGLMDLGVAPRGTVAILSGNRPEWLYIDVGAQAANVIDVPIYPTNTAEQVQYILEDSGAEIVFCENRLQLEKVLSIKGTLPKLRLAVVVEPWESKDPFVTDLMDVMARGRKALDRAALEARWKAIDPESVATLIYTSGTTGNPKGVMLCHRNLAANIIQLREYMTLEPGQSNLQHLPLCHAYGRMETYVVLMYNGVVAMAESIEAIPQNLKEVRPYVLVTVPRLLEKIHAKITGGLKDASPVKRALFSWASGVGRDVVEHKMAKTEPPLLTRLQYAVASRVVFSKIREALGGRLEVLVYAAAPLSVEIQRFFAATGLICMEAYGLTETSPGMTGNKPDDFRLGSVGKPAHDTEVKIAPDGEIVCRGPQVMLGYHNRPEETAEALEGGWFHTGDIGRIDADGFVWITDRKKDLIITAGGKNIAPQNIENLLKLDEAIEQVAVVGDRKSYLVALIVPSFAWLRSFAQQKGLAGDNAALVRNPAVRAEIEARIAKANKKLARYETVKKIALLDAEFSVENGMLTPTMKVRRKNVLKTFEGVIESLYAGGGAADKD